MVFYCAFPQRFTQINQYHYTNLKTQGLGNFKCRNFNILFAFRTEGQASINQGSTRGDVGELGLQPAKCVSWSLFLFHVSNLSKGVGVQMMLFTYPGNMWKLLTGSGLLLPVSISDDTDSRICYWNILFFQHVPLLLTRVQSKPSEKEIDYFCVFPIFAAYFLIPQYMFFKNHERTCFKNISPY